MLKQLAIYGALFTVIIKTLCLEISLIEFFTSAVIIAYTVSLIINLTSQNIIMTSRNTIVTIHNIFMYSQTIVLCANSACHRLALSTFPHQGPEFGMDFSVSSNLCIHTFYK